MAMRKLSGLALAMLLAAVPSRAQHWELTGTAGFTTKASIEVTNSDISSVQVNDGFSWGVSAGYYFNPHYGFEAAFNSQATAIGIEGFDDSIFDITVNQLHGNFIFQFGLEDAKARPFIVAGAGASVFNPESGFDSETKFSWSIGGGLKYFANDRFGVRIQGLYKPTIMNDDPGGYWCDGFGFCYYVADTDWLDQVEFSGGLVFKFGG
jgi:opacity protein-like surface antigen